MCTNKFGLRAPQKHGIKNRNCRLEKVVESKSFSLLSCLLRSGDKLLAVARGEYKYFRVYIDRRAINAKCAQPLQYASRFCFTYYPSCSRRHHICEVRNLSTLHTRFWSKIYMCILTVGYAKSKMWSQKSLQFAHALCLKNKYNPRTASEKRIDNRKICRLNFSL